MEEAIRRLYREGVAACFLEVDEANAAAVRLYRSLGFERCLPCLTVDFLESE